MHRSIRRQIGCWLHERWRAEMALSSWLSRAAGISWGDLHNRNERLLPGSDHVARVCDWRDSSWLTVARVFPGVGARLLRTCLSQHPIASADAMQVLPTDQPDISVVLPISGTERIPQLRAVLANLFSQEGATFEIIVSEEGETCLLEGEIPPGVRHVFRSRAEGRHYSKSRMLNAGCQAASGKYLLLHDADIMVPKTYLRDIVARLDSSWDAVRPIRFLFCLDQATSETVQRTGSLQTAHGVEDIMQNFPGGSLAVRRDIYHAIGGMDESFEDWGGEDNEFLDRLNTTNVFRGAFLPAVHLWHSNRPRKGAADNAGLSLLVKKRERPPEDRIAALLRQSASGERTPDDGHRAGDGSSEPRTPAQPRSGA